MAQRGSEGWVNQYCASDNDCAPSLYCKPSRSGTQTCRPNEPLDICYGSYRDVSDRSCKRVVNGREIYSKDSCCDHASAMTPADRETCKDSFVYGNGNTGADVQISCARLENGVVVPVKAECCVHNSDMTFVPEWVKYSMSPQYYGTFR